MVRCVVYPDWQTDNVRFFMSSRSAPITRRGVALILTPAQMGRRTPFSQVITWSSWVKNSRTGYLLFVAFVVSGLLSPYSPLGHHLSCQAAEAQRPRVSEDLSDPRSVEKCLSAVCEATNSENLDGFLDCFTTATRKQLRKPAAMLFVQHDLTMDLMDSQIIEQTESRSEAVVKYRTKRSDDTYTVVSLVDLRKENGYWKISKERIQTVEHSSPSMCSPSRYACFGGQCRVRN